MHDREERKKTNKMEIFMLLLSTFRKVYRMYTVDFSVE